MCRTGDPDTAQAAAAESVMATVDMIAAAGSVVPAAPAGGTPDPPSPGVPPPIPGQLTLGDAPMCRTGDPDTAQAAAAEQTPARLSTGRTLALRGLAQGPATDFELAERVGRAQTSIGCRRKDLVRAGLAADTGRRRPSPSGSPSIVWALTPAGHDAVAAL